MKKGILIGLITLFVCSDAIAQESPVLPTGYHIDFEKYGFEELGSIPSLVKKAGEARVILSGENHYFSGFNSLGEYRLLRFFHEKAGVRHFVIELSPTRALYMDRYFNSNDTTAKKFLQATSSKDYMKLFDSIRIWNQSLPDTQRIQVHGLDVERFYDMTVMRLGDVIQKRGLAPKNLRKGSLMVSMMAKKIEEEGLTDWESDDEDSESSSEGNNDSRVDTTVAAHVIESSDTTAADIETNHIEQNVNIQLMTSEDDDFDSEDGAMELYLWLSKNAAVDGKFADSSLSWKNWMGSDFDEYANAFKQLREWYIWTKTDNTAQQVAWREEHMYLNMVSLLKADPKAKFFGQFGRCHTSLSKQQQDCGWFEYNSLLTRLRTRYFKDKKSVMSIGIFYKEKEFNGKDICAVNLGNTIYVNAEVMAILKTVDQGMMVYDVKDSLGQLVELAKKFDFVMAHDLIEDDEENGEEGGRNEYDYYMANHVGMSLGGRWIPQVLSSSLIKHFGDNNFEIQDAPRWFIPVEATMISVHSHLGIGYTYSGKDLFKAENGERLKYRSNVYHLDAGIQTRGSYSPWIWGLGVRVMYVRHQIQYVPPTPDFGNPVFDGVKTIQSREWVPAAYVSVRRRFDDIWSLYSKAGYQQALEEQQVWQFKSNGLNYFNGSRIGGMANGLFMEIGLTINFDSID